MSFSKTSVCIETATSHIEVGNTPVLISWIFVCTIESKDYHRLLTKKSVLQCETSYKLMIFNIPCFLR